MWTQRDQIQAYQFLRRRLVSALVAADANHPVSPSRRLVLATVLGLVAALLVTAVFGIIGLLNPSGGKDWLAGGKVIVEEGTGARFVLGADGVLHPVLNYASARLLAGGAGDATVSVSSENLGKAGRGTQIGIPGAPDSLPAASALVTTPWTSCSRTTQDAPASAEPRTAVLLAAPASGVELPRDQGVIVRPPQGDRFLLAGGRRYKLSDEAATALQFDSYPTIAVSARWIDTVPAGRDLTALPVDGAGDRGPTVGGRDTRVGQVLAVVDAMAAPGSATSYYLVRRDGLEPVGQTEASLLVTTEANAAAYEGTPKPVEVRAADVAAVPKVAAPRGRRRRPRGLPRPHPRQGADHRRLGRVVRSGQPVARFGRIPAFPWCQGNPGRHEDRSTGGGRGVRTPVGGSRRRRIRLGHHVPGDRYGPEVPGGERAGSGLARLRKRGEVTGRR